MLQAVDGDLRERGQRLLLVERLRHPLPNRARTLYLACDYGQEARVRAFSKPETNMILFRVAL